MAERGQQMAAGARAIEPVSTPPPPPPPASGYARQCEDCGERDTVTDEGYRCEDCRLARRESREAAEADRRVAGRT